MWEVLASVKLAVTLLIILAIGSILGTLIPQGQPQAYYEHYASASWSKVILATQLDHVYSSVWFLLLVAGLALNLIVCSLKRLPQALKSAFDQPEPDGLRLPKVRLSRTLECDAQVEEAGSTVRRMVEAFQGFDGKAVESKEPDQAGKRIFFAQSGRFSRLGAYVVHVAILILMAGGLATTLFGFKGEVWLSEGQTIDHIRLRNGQSMPLGFQVHQTKFIFEKYKNGTPKLWKSDLNFLVDGEVVKTGSCMVNSPVTFGKITFYMSSYDEKKELDWIGLEIKDQEGPAKTLKISTGKTKDVEGLGQVSILDYDTNWRGGGFAAKIKLVRPDGKESHEFWVRPKPPFQMPPQGEDVPEFKLTDAKAKSGGLLAGLQANYDPGIWFVWIGGIVMLLGLISALFWSHQKLWVEVAPHKKGSRIVLAGSTQRNRPSFELKFKALVMELQESLAGIETGKIK